ncbi:glutathione S-transferase [Collybia nuda]|uniref:Glutathione S-transferase n=1 Tax=Collybia nuda TaxID=64659 RepID=A0A9P5XSU4_9AGAR|nr:glutathione S-transferase [Collybia nuda]
MSEGSTFRDMIEKGGKFEPEIGRYHLYVSYSCPYAARTLITRKLKGLESVVDATVVGPHYDLKLAWPFAGPDPFPGTDRDPLFDSNYLREIYLKAFPDYAGRFSVPVLWDKKLATIANNDSGDIIRIFNSAFNHLLPQQYCEVDLYPATSRKEIDEINAWVFDMLNHGVYKAAFAKSQNEYESAAQKVFEALDRVEKILSTQKFLVGDQLTEADVRLWATAIRFDVVYFGGAFRCNVRRIRDGYPAIHLWMRKLYWENEAFKAVTRFDHIKITYHGVSPVGLSFVLQVQRLTGIIRLTL